MNIEACDLETLALSYLDNVDGKPERQTYLSWCTDNNVEPENDLWACVLLQCALLVGDTKLYPVFSTEPVKLNRYKFETIKSKAFSVRAPSLQQARNWLSALNQKEVRLLTITKYL